MVAESSTIRIRCIELLRPDGSTIVFRTYFGVFARKEQPIASRVPSSTLCSSFFTGRGIVVATQQDMTTAPSTRTAPKAAARKRLESNVVNWVFLKGTKAITLEV